MSIGKQIKYRLPASRNKNLFVFQEKAEIEIKYNVSKSKFLICRFGNNVVTCGVWTHKQTQ